MAGWLSGVGEREVLEDPGVWLVPSARWLAPVFLGLVGLVALVLLGAGVWPYLRPVHLHPHRLTDLYRPPLDLAGHTWQAAGRSDADLSQIRFCRYLIPTALAGHSGAIAMGTPAAGAQAYTLTYPDPEQARVAGDRLDQGMLACPTRSGRWVGGAVHERRGARVNRYQLEGMPTQPQFAFTVRYANTVAVIISRDDADPDQLVRSYRSRVAEVSRLD
ncbi:hypothetical protein HJ590_15585 [Naumannella sp. ID2617S]|nr:hypothetical protein [Naumannella sp. ID2617S]